MPSPENPSPSDLPRFSAAEDYRATLFGGAALALIVSAGAIVALNVLDTAALAPVAVYAFLLATTLFITGWVVGLRQEVWRESRRRGDSRPSDVNPVEELERFGRLGAPVTLGLGALFSLGFATLPLGDFLQLGLAPSIGPARDLASPPTDGSATFLAVAGGLAIAAAFPLLVLARAASRVDPDRLPEAPSIAIWLRGGQWVASLAGLALLLEGLGFPPGGPAGWITAVLLVLSALVACEVLLRAGARLFRARPVWTEVSAPVELVTLAALFRGRNPLDSLFEQAQERLGATVRTARAVALFRRVLVPLAVAMGAVLWLSTCVTVIPPEEEGLRLRFGRLVSRRPVPPGLAWKLPWPFATIDRYPTRRVQTLTLGFAGRERASLLWTEAHTGVEYKMLLGDGRELVSVDAEVAYRIRDVIAYALVNENPRETLDALAYRLLMQKTVVTDLDTLLLVDRDRFSAGFTRDLQKAADAKGLGLEILYTNFVSLHPPVRIAPEYQAVVGAEIERDTLVIRAEVERAANLPRTEADAKEAVLSAKAQAAVEIADARGGADRYLAALESFLGAEALYRFRRSLEALEAGLTASGLRFYVLDHTLEEKPSGSASGQFWLDLRPAGGQRNP